MGRPRKGLEIGSYVALTPYEKNVKSKKTLQNKRAAGRLRSEKLRRSRGVKQRPLERRRIPISKSKKKIVKKKLNKMNAARVRRCRAKKKAIVID